jgi:hypothetical protein
MAACSTWPSIRQFWGVKICYNLFLTWLFQHKFHREKPLFQHKFHREKPMVFIYVIEPYSLLTLRNLDSCYDDASSLHASPFDGSLIRLVPLYVFSLGTNRTCLNLLEFAPICIKFPPNIAPCTLYTLKKISFFSEMFKLFRTQYTYVILL